LESARAIRTTVACVLLSLSGVLTACGHKQESQYAIRQWTDDLSFRIMATPTPPVSEEITQYKIIVQDRKTGQPIETGEGRIFGSTRDQAKVNNGLAKGKEVGTYYTTVRFPIATDWAMGLQFRRDSTAPLERTNDWVQTVLPAPPYGSDTTHH
jgi:hypothetical protein